MTIPSVYKRNTVGGAFTAENIGGTAIGITSATNTTAGNPITRTFTLADQGVDGIDRKTGPKDVDYTIEALANTGTFAYDQTSFMFRGNQANNTTKKLLKIKHREHMLGIKFKTSKNVKNSEACLNT